MSSHHVVEYISPSHWIILNRYIALFKNYSLPLSLQASTDFNRHIKKTLNATLCNYKTIRRFSG